MTRIALLQMTAGIDPAVNARTVTDAVAEAAQGGATMLFTPEMTGLLDRDRSRAATHIVPEQQNPVLEAARAAASRHRIWVALGSIAVFGEGGRWANRSILIGPHGEIVARYDKIHMFDVDLASGESWRESNAFEPGREVVTSDGTPLGRLGLTVCYDIRFPALFEELGRRSCDAIAIPAAFTVPTGKAHWHLLQRARAVEASAWVIAASQVGDHEDGRRTFGHSLVVDPWGDIVLDMGGDAPGVGFAEIDAERTAEVRRQLPSLANKRPIPN
ncbi:2-oxoglutaramate amidase [Tsuneonella dongtanensis]|uniref:2-oxoglutaramate amidase n=1 Tax=Tsuneonella dongtanensis TaxID=692370 RepID=A0A1B2AEX5_9SPHN|nr:carbon-nitrogen hydrolase family protein [Tsuneonella dongtanensis]ANY20699.1 2-oxoglutaramate amidase [Tsuneonella dongtanensis]